MNTETPGQRRLACATKCLIIVKPRAACKHLALPDDQFLAGTLEEVRSEEARLKSEPCPKCRRKAAQ